MNFRSVRTLVTPRRLVGALTVLVVVYIGFGVLLFTQQTLLVFPAAHLYSDIDATEAPAGVRVVAVNGAVPLWISGEHDRIVLMVHGNAEWVGNVWAGYAGPLDSLQTSFAALEFRDVAGTAGPLTEAQLQQDIVAAIDVLVAEGWPLDRIVLHGRSIGGGVAALALPDRIPAGLVLESTFDSLSNVVSGTFPAMLYPRVLLATPLDTQAHLRGTGVPVLQVHDLHDSVVPVRRARALRVTLNHPAVVETAGFRHGAAIVLQDERAHREWASWLDRVMPPSTPRLRSPQDGHALPTP